MMKEYQFTRYQNGEYMAEGVTVTAETEEEALEKANWLASRTYQPGFRLEPCRWPEDFFEYQDYGRTK